MMIPLSIRLFQLFETHSICAQCVIDGIGEMWGVTSSIVGRNFRGDF